MLGTFKISSLSSSEERPALTSEVSNWQACQRIEDLCETRASHLSVVFVPSLSCNLKCTYCFESESPFLKNSFLMKNIPLESIVDAIRYLVLELDISSVSYSLFGGEPLVGVNLSWYRRLLNQLEVLPFNRDTLCVTNGTSQRGIDESLQWKLRIDEYQISLDGIRSVHDSRRIGNRSFERTIWAINRILEEGRKVSVRVNVDSNNVRNLPQLATLVENEGWTKNSNFSMYLYPVVSESAPNSPHHETELLKNCLSHSKDLKQIPWSFDFHGISAVDSIIKDSELYLPRLHYCAAQRNQIVFLPDGSISACEWVNGFDELKVGYWSGDKYKFILTKFDELNLRNSSRIQACQDCTFRFFCGGGCSYKALIQNKSLSIPTCPPIAANIEEYVQFLAFRGELS
ncbi:radical SAM/SPASM domain-containing protein [Arcanobacterium phocae]|uniref:radical SAM/SPASM domain-containing protein n=1 Tax=Arcanobacterium phocae TaxID=131112 RepID=UPI0020A1FB9F|nr:radical SAM protein [Arcanobacterium phocae]